MNHLTTYLFLLIFTFNIFGIKVCNNEKIHKFNIDQCIRLKHKDWEPQYIYKITWYDIEYYYVVKWNPYTVLPGGIITGGHWDNKTIKFDKRLEYLFKLIICPDNKRWR
jgi:hypothetical protein